MKIVFLDFDGVLHANTHPTNFFEHLDTFKSVVGNTPVVISSAWRESFPLRELVEMLDGVNVIGMTPIRDNNTSRCARLFECIDWLEQNNMLCADWVAVDDQRSLFEQDSPCPNLILCDEMVGFTKDSSAEKELKIFVDTPEHTR